MELKDGAAAEARQSPKVIQSADFWPAIKSCSH